MIFDKAYWTKVLKRILYFVFSILLLCIGFKLSVFYMPFLIAFIISLLIEPLIKKMMKNTRLTRKTSSIIIFIIVFGMILGSLVWGISTLFSEASNLLQGLNNYFDKAYILFQNFTNNFKFDGLKISDEILRLIQNSTDDVLSQIYEWARVFLNNLLSIITSIPEISIYFVITITALYLICVDKIYILDQLEHHLPRLWVKKLSNHLRELITSLGGYLKAEATLILVSFIISLIGLYILKFTGFNIEYPLLMAIFIGFVDALPILGSGTVMVPWAIISGLNGDLKLGIAIIILLIIMSIVRQFLEPRLVSKNIGVHPIFTLIAMYTGFKFIGVIGMLLGPILLIIIKNIYASLIDQGIVKTLLDKK
ncbi:MAG: sporulation integral membrane protein YtvI [Clostridia bacterium]|nr:sporulation integral membrane protein YtvI [Clostridia bacterium]